MPFIDLFSKPYLVPLDDRGQLNCKSIFGGREKLRAFQDSYHQAVNDEGRAGRDRSGDVCSAD
jgi:hypothetical protein